MPLDEIENANSLNLAELNQEPQVQNQNQDL